MKKTTNYFKVLALTMCIIVSVSIFAYLGILLYNATNGNKKDSGIKIANYGKNMTLNAYNAESKNTLELYTIGTYDNEYCVFYFDLGLIKRTPVYTSVALEYGNQDHSFKLIFNELTEESLENSITDATEIIDTHSYTGGFNIGFEQDVEVGGEILGAGLKANFTTSLSSDQHWTNNWGTTVSKSETTKNGYVKSYSEGFEISFEVSEEKGFKRGYSYRVSFYETVKCFAVLYYDIKTKEYTIAFENMLIPNQTILVIEESTNTKGEFDYAINKTIDFDVDKAIEIAENNMPKQDDSIHIRNKDDFFRYMQLDTAGKNYILDMVELDLSNSSWMPVDFKGTLDGQGCEIRGWRFTQKFSGNIGLFATNYGIIKNFNITDIVIDSDENQSVFGTLNAGILCGSNEGTISNINVTECNIKVNMGSVDNNNNNHVFVGGISGYNQGTIENCKISTCELNASVGSKYEDAWCYVGGAVGYSASGTLKYIVSSFNVISSSAKAEKKIVYEGIFHNKESEKEHGRPYSYVGGIVGYCMETNLDVGLEVFSVQLHHEISRPCDHDSNKGEGGSGNDIKGN